MGRDELSRHVVSSVGKNGAKKQLLRFFVALMPNIGNIVGPLNKDCTNSYGDRHLQIQLYLR